MQAQHPGNPIQRALLVIAGVAFATAAIGQVQPQFMCFNFPQSARSCCGFENLDDGRVCAFPNGMGGTEFVFCPDEVLIDNIFPEYRRADSGWETLETVTTGCAFIERRCVQESLSCVEVCPVACFSTCTGKIPNVQGDPCGGGIY